MRNIVARKKLSSIQIIIFILIFLCGTFLRFVDFDDPPLDFHPARQFHSALIARSYFLKDNGNLPGKSADYQHEAEMRGSQEPRIEPPIMERLAAWGYKIIGDADLRVPRAISIVFWLIGGIGLFRLCRQFLGITGSLVGFGFFLLFPYTIFASRSFQPDPLMVALMIWS
ncbi:MAG TPA: glycosyltransferase family 39 protein, partial [Flexilinea sp.]|nr:glycosyltransferase family 39 protein [Flexilinea sp.]